MSPGCYYTHQKQAAFSITYFTQKFAGFVSRPSYWETRLVHYLFRKPRDRSQRAIDYLGLVICELDFTK